MYCAIGLGVLRTGRCHRGALSEGRECEAAHLLPRNHRIEVATILDVFCNDLRTQGAVSSSLAAVSASLTGTLHRECMAGSTVAERHLCAGITKAHSEEAADLVDAALQNASLHLGFPIPQILGKLVPLLMPTAMS